MYFFANGDPPPQKKVPLAPSRVLVPILKTVQLCDFCFLLYNYFFMEFYGRVKK